MTSSCAITISQEEFLMFHNIERELYKILVIDLSRDLIESMQHLALWIWLERVGYCNVVCKILSSSYTSINELAGEGITCLNCINTSMIHLLLEDDDIPHIRSLMDKEMSLQILYKNKALAIRGVTTILQDVCVRALSHIMKQINMRNSSESMVENQKMVITCSKDHICSNSMKPSEIGLDEVKGAKSNTMVPNHNIERELYKTLVINLSRDIIESMQLLALWIWLERVGYCNVVYKILSSSYTSINELADEGVTCLNCINTSMMHLFFEDDDIPHMRSLMDKEIPLQILYKNKVSAIRGVTTILQDVCVRALSDIMKQINMRNSSESMVGNQKMAITCSKDHICSNLMKPSKIGLDEVEGTKSNTIVMPSNNDAQRG